VALAYVHQQVELVKLSYAIGCKERAVKDMLDRKEGLGYNIENLKDPLRLEQVLLAKNVDIAMPKPGNVVRVARLEPSRTQDELRAYSLGNKLNILNALEFFSAKAEAQTKDR